MIRLFQHTYLLIYTYDNITMRPKQAYIAGFSHLPAISVSFLAKGMFIVLNCEVNDFIVSDLHTATNVSAVHHGW